MRKVLTLALAITAFAAIAGTAAASHSWSNYHWARTANPFAIKLGYNVSGAWKSYLATTSRDWTTSSVLDTAIVASSADPRKCRPTSGRVEVCNASYGRNGWLGLAQIWVSGGHISQGTAKVNDTYFSLSQYNYPTKRQHVMCQEIGHTWGLGHQDETGADLGTCMDYANALDNPAPDAHDYEQLEKIYAHLDNTTTIATGLAGSGSAKPVRVERNDRIVASIITEHFRDGSQRITHVFWALETRGHAAEHALGQDD